MKLRRRVYASSWPLEFRISRSLTSCKVKDLMKSVNIWEFSQKLFVKAFFFFFSSGKEFSVDTFISESLFWYLYMLSLSIFHKLNDDWNLLYVLIFPWICLQIVKRALTSPKYPFFSENVSKRTIFFFQSVSATFTVEIVFLDISLSKHYRLASNN